MTDASPTAFVYKGSEGADSGPKGDCSGDAELDLGSGGLELSAEEANMLLSVDQVQHLSEGSSPADFVYKAAEDDAQMSERRRLFGLFGW